MIVQTDRLMTESYSESETRIGCINYNTLTSPSTVRGLGTLIFERSCLQSSDPPGKIAYIMLKYFVQF